MRTALVCDAGGFIAGHLVKQMKADGYWAEGQQAEEVAAYRQAESLGTDLDQVATKNRLIQPGTDQQ